MARSVSTIYAQLIAAKNAQSALSGLTSTSQVSKWNLILWIVAAAQAIQEQFSDQAVSGLETQIAATPVFTAQWIALMCKLFQYSSTTPQVVEVTVSNVYPYVTIGYPIVNNTLCPVTQSAVVSNTNNQLIIKVASNSAPLSSPQLTALQSFLNVILPPNIQYTLISDNADRLLIEAQVFYNAAYSGVIQANMDAAINNYLFNIPFNGIFTVSGLTEAMLAVVGVKDVILNEVYWRKYTDAPPPAAMNELVTDNTLISRNYQTYAGYVVVEDTADYTPDDLITYTPS